MGVYEKKKGSGVWWVLWYEHGTRHREKVGRYKDAKDLYNRRKADARAGVKLPDLRARNVQFSELIDDTIAYAQSRRKTPRDYVGKGNLLKKKLGKTSVEDLTPQTLENWIEARNVSSATFNRYKAFLSLAFRLAIRNGKATENIARQIERKAEPKGRQRFLSRAEYTKVLTVLLKADQRAAVTLSVFTGMRLMEQFSLDLAQVDWDERKAYLSKTKNGDDRAVPLNEEAFTALQMLAGDRTTGLVHLRKRKGTKAVQPRWYGKALEAVGIKGASWHTNRHTFCSWHAMAGTPLKTIQELAGHKTIAITARYAHLCPDHTARESERIVPAPKVVEIVRRKA